MSQHFSARSVGHAWRGLRFVWKTEPHFRFHSLCAIAVFLCTVLLPLEPWQVFAVGVVIILVLVLELLNSALERLVDIVEPRWSAPVKEIKDILAGMVLLVSAFSALVGASIFLPLIFNFFHL